MGRLILLLWPIALIDILLGQSALSLLGAAVLAGYIAVGIGRSHAGNIALALGAVIAALAVVWADGTPAVLVSAFSTSLVFAAFVPAAHLLRTVAEQDRRVLRFKECFAQEQAEARAGWLLIGSNMLGSVLTVGAVAVLAPTFAKVSEQQRRRRDAAATVAGTALALTWSPFFVAMAVISSFLPAVPLWSAMLLGLGLTTAGLALGLLMMGVPAPLATTMRALRALGGFLPLIAIAGGAVILLRLSGTLSTLQAACLAMPPLCMVLIASGPGKPLDILTRIIDTLRRTFARLGGIGAEVGIVALAFALGTVLRGSPTVAALIDASNLASIPPSLIILFIPAAMIVAGMLSMHPIVSASLILSIFAEHHVGLSDIALMGATLVGWSAAAMLSVSGLLLMITTSISDVPRGQLILGSNALFAPSYALVSAVLLILLNQMAV